MSKPEEVKAAAVNTPDNRVQIRFVPVVSNGNAKSPKFRAMISLPGGLVGLCIEAPIYKNDEGTYDVQVPGGRFAVLKSEPQVIEHNGKSVMLAEPDPTGAAKMERFSATIKTAFHAYQTSGNAVQLIAF